MTQIITNTNGGGGSGGGGGDGDMKKSVYDPNNIQADAFDYNNFENTPDLSGYQTTGNLVTNLSNADNTHYPSAKAVADAISSSGGGDMLKSVYDPDNVNANAFDYNNFINTPTIPTVNNATLKIQENGTDVATFTANASTGVTANISVPTKVSDLSNDSGFVTNQVDDTAYGSSWDGKTTKAPSQNAVYDKISAMDTTISSKAADSDVVKLTGNQTIAGTKTFSTSPLVPSKTTAATNTGTAIATEAQVYLKQDKLTAQTAYTSKGTATKVPTITTNTLGQVTNISETSISFPVTSVNGSTGAITGLQTTSNLKTSLADDSDTYYPSQKAVKAAVDAKQDALTTQTAYTTKGTSTKVPTISTNTLGQVTAITETSIAFPVTSVNGNTGAVTVNDDVRVFAVPSVNDDISDMITRLSAGKGVILHEIVSGTDAFYKVDYHDDVNGEITASLIYSYNGGYARFYTIEYNYSTKKVSTKTSSLTYFFAPETAGTQGQVLTKTASGYEWQAPTGGIQLAPNTELNIKYHRYGSQASYDSLNQYYTDTANDTAYFTI